MFDTNLISDLNDNFTSKLIRMIIRLGGLLKTIGDKMVTVPVDEEKVRQLAYELSQKPMSYNECIWLYAENELQLRPAYSNGVLYSEENPNKIAEIEPDSIVEQPSEEDIRQLAESVHRMGISIHDLHWLIAERKYLYDLMKNN